ncbi:TIGR02444 family protein [Kordiimonas sp.]|uniref:TIGR02444 family protein n=1 Tax=Kordiimonas sp. TaxID=1970157 RepID=UPI003A949879
MTDHHKEERADVQAPDIIQKLVHDPDIFWRFAVAVYGKPQVKKACLEAQDRFGADVNLLLLYLWCDGEALTLSAETTAALHGTSNLWQTEILGPLREIRRGMKDSGGYREFLAQELEIEKRAQKALIACLSGAPSAASREAFTSGFINHADALGLPDEIRLPLREAAQQVARSGVS